MKYTIIIDNLCCNDKLLGQWGYSALLETPQGNLLIDTGEHGHVLTHNLEKLHIDSNNIKHLLLSHGHYDHCGGLGEALKTLPQAQVWASPHVTTKRRTGKKPEQQPDRGGGSLLAALKFSPIVDQAEILPNVFAFEVPLQNRNLKLCHQKELWEINSKEQIIPDTFSDDLSLLVKGNKGYSLLLGCAHAGIINILDHVKNHFEIDELYAVVGGMHMFALSQEELELWLSNIDRVKVKLWRPNHCTGFKAAARLGQIFEDVDWAGAGYCLDL